jgi:hypothetical protein
MSDTTTNGSPVEAAVSAATLDAPREKLNKKAITADLFLLSLVRERIEVRVK